MESINIIQVKEILNKISEVMDESKDYLIELDSAMGDGDLGLTMSEGFRAIVEEMDKVEGKDIGAFIGKMGMVMGNTVPSTMGTLMATAMMKGGKAIKGLEKISLKDMVDFGYAAIDGIKMRGKAEVGDKTILDSIYPAVESLKKSYEKQLCFKEAFENAYDAAEIGVIMTKDMKSKFGRAAYYGEESIGKQDPGATAAMLLFKGIYLYFKE
ncbi:dihydroxyacetone kinase subunit DhaL [uncultured Clostridium sp.]|uniref:dihydroxyacetone kinase subunit DhaL n=1 Tax=uncultured Clostridium sp. TaxID=59620 RepID=UPI0028EDA70F|nr:dihydroxyacetone kinase subunit DhaL [uncultured Clostridium sp.]